MTDTKAKAEAMRLARVLVMDQIRVAGGKVSNYTRKAITQAAETYLAAHPELVVPAKDNLEEG